MQHGDFTGLAKKYSEFRPKYADSVLGALIGLFDRPVAKLSLADVGAGTGIWTRMMAERGPAKIVAVEPNDDMRKQGEADSKSLPIKWQKGTGEKTGLKEKSFDLVSMASSFHWVDFEKGCREFARVLRKNGRFVALWNPRSLEDPHLIDIENHIKTLKPDIKRVSSGKSGLVETLTEKLSTSGVFEDVLYLEGRHMTEMSPADYIGAWRSVNDVRVQLGPELFETFIRYCQDRLKGVSKVKVHYLTRAWAARKI